MKHALLPALTLLTAGLVYAASPVYRSSTSYTATSTLVITNTSQTAWALSAVDWNFGTNLYTGPCRIYRVRSNVTNLLVAQPVTAASSVFMNKGEFEGSWVVPSDKLRITQTGAVSVVVTVTTEEAR